MGTYRCCITYSLIIPLPPQTSHGVPAWYASLLSPSPSHALHLTFSMAGLAGLEPATYGLTIRYSTVELQPNTG